MHEPVFAISFLAGCTALCAMGRSETAVSSEAHDVRRSVSALVESEERSHALFGDKAAAISEILTLANECAEVGWDGAGAEPISTLAAGLAADFVRALPAGVPLPQFAPEPDGSLSLDWIQSRHRVFSVSVGANNRLAYAWLDGTDRGHGVARFDGQTVPSRILNGVRDIVNHDSATLRAA